MFATSLLFFQAGHGLNNLGMESYNGVPSTYPDWVYTPEAFGNPYDLNFKKVPSPVVAKCNGIGPFSAPAAQEECISKLRETLYCKEVPELETMWTFVWLAQGIMFGDSTLSKMLARDPKHPKDGFIGFVTPDSGALKYFVSQDSFWANFLPMILFATAGLIFFIAACINGCWFPCIEKCRSCWGACCCKCCCNDRHRKTPRHVSKCKIATNCIVSWLYFILSAILLGFFGYYSIEFTTPYRMNQTACAITAANYGVAFGANGLLDVGVRMMSLMMEVGSNNHSIMNMTHNDPITGPPGIGHINVQPYDKMCPKGQIMAYPANINTPASWKDAVGGVDAYSEDYWEQCYRWTPHWSTVRNSYSKKYSWGRIARDFGRRSYYSMEDLEAFNTDDRRFFDFDEFKGRAHSYVGYPLDCEYDHDGEKQCAMIHSADYNEGGRVNYSTTCLDGQVEGTDCFKYHSDGGNPSTTAGGEVNRPYEFFYRSQDMSKASLIPEHLFGGEFADQVLEAGLKFHLNTGGFQAQTSVYDDVHYGGAVESPSGIATILANYIQSGATDETQDMNPAVALGWLRDMCGRKANASGMTLETFCVNTMNSTQAKGNLVTTWTSEWCQLENDDTSSDGKSTIESPLAAFMNGSTYGRSYEQPIIGGKDAMFSDQTLSFIPPVLDYNRRDICETILARNYAPRYDDSFPIDSFVQYYRGTPNAIQSHSTFAINSIGGINIPVAGITVGSYPFTGHYSDVQAQHTYIKDVFDTTMYAGELSDLILAPSPGHIVTPGGGEHPPFLGFSRASNYIDAKITEATSATIGSVTRWPEYFEFLMTIHDAVWVIYDSAMGIIPILPVYEPTDGAGSPDNISSYINVFQLSLTIIGVVLWVAMLIVWIWAGVHWCCKKDSRHAGCLWRSMCVVLTIGQLLFSLSFIVTSLAIPFIGEVTLFCNLEAMTPLALDGNELPPLYEDLFGPAETNALKKCLFQGEDFANGEVNFTFPEEALTAGSDLTDSLPTVLDAYASLGMTINEATLSNQYAPLWNNGDFSHRDSTGQWAHRTKVMALIDIARSLKTDREKQIVGLRNRLDQVVVSTVRGLTKKTDGVDATWVNTGDSPFDPIMSSLVDKTLAVTYINDNNIRLELEPEAVDVISEEMVKLSDATTAAFDKFADEKIWLGRSVDLGNGYFHYSKNAPTKAGECTRATDYAANGDFFNAIVTEADFTGDDANLTRAKAQEYATNFSASDEIGMVSLIELFRGLKFDAVSKYADGSHSVYENWHSNVDAYFTKLFGDLSTDIQDRKICNGPDGTKISATDAGVDLKDICVLALRKPPIATTFHLKTENSTLLEPHWMPDSRAVLTPVAGGCLNSYTEFIHGLEEPHLDHKEEEEPPLLMDTDGKTPLDPPQLDMTDKMFDAYHALEAWAENNCATLAAPTANEFYCIRPARRHAQMGDTIVQAIQPDLIIEAAEDEAQIKETYSLLLPNDYALYKGRDARWTNPILPLFVDDAPSTVDGLNPSWTKALGFTYLGGNYTDDLKTSLDFGVPIFGAPTGPFFGATNYPADFFDLTPGFLAYRKCFLGTDHVYPITKDRAAAAPEYLATLATLQDGINEKKAQYQDLLAFMVNIEYIQRLSTMAQNQKTKGPHAVSELAGVEEYFTIRDLLSLPTPDDIAKTDAEIISQIEKDIAFILNSDELVNNTARCKEILDTSTGAIENICGGALGLISMMFWLIWLMALLFMVFYCCGFIQMHYWINLSKQKDHSRSGSSSTSSKGHGRKYTSSSSSTSGDVDLLHSAYYGQNHDFDHVNEHNVHVKDDQGNNCLHLAAYKNEVATMEHIIDINDDLINERNHAFYTPLHIAVYENHHDAVELLLKRGADHGLRDEFGDTPLTAAARMGHHTIVDKLLDHHANPLKATRTKTFARDIALASGHVAIADRLASEYHADDLTKSKHYYDHVEYSSYSSYEFEYYYGENE